MKKPWNPVEAFEVLRKCFNNGIIFAVFTDNTITPSITVNILVLFNVVIKTGTFQAQYEEWHSFPENK